MEIALKEIRTKALKRGILLGLILLIIGIASLYVIANITSIWIVVLSPVLISFVMPIIAAAFFILNLRKNIGGYWSFRQATTGIFLLFFTAYIISSIGNYAFGKFVAPGINEKVKKSLIIAATSAMEKQGADQELIDEKVADIEKQFAMQQDLTVRVVAQGVVFSIIILFVFALIFAAIFKKELPLFASQSDSEI